VGEDGCVDGEALSECVKFLRIFNVLKPSVSNVIAFLRMFAVDWGFVVGLNGF
jgi:hypothetical protein